MLDLIRTPDLAAEVTLQPIEAFGFDAAIIFSDILPPLVGMGFELDFIGGVGPRIANRIERTYDVDVLGTPPAAETMAGTLEAIRIVTRELGPRGVPVIGFCGAPVHARELCDRGRRNEGLRAHEGVHALRAGGMAAPDEQARDRAGGLSRRPGAAPGPRRSRCSTPGPGVRSGKPTTSATCSRTTGACSRRSPGQGCR